MRFTPANRSERTSAIDLTPLVDVVMLLIIFFMTTAQFVKMTQAELELPQQEGEEERQRESSELVINITTDSDYIVNGQSASLETVKRKVAYELAQAGREREELLVTIRADRRTATVSLNRLIAALSELGVRSSALAVEVRR